MYSQFFLASVFLLFSLVLIVLFLRIVFGAFSGYRFSFPRLVENMKLKRKNKILSEADRLLDEEKLEESISLLKDSFFLETGRNDPEFLDIVYTHNISILARFVTISEKKSRHISNLPIIETLLVSRIELLSSFSDLRISLRKIKEKNRYKNKENYRWAVNEVELKLEDIRERLETNKKTLESQIKSLVKELQADSGMESDGFGYH